MRISYVDGSRLRRSLVAACDQAQRIRQELNRINVFPVPDGDTGTNLALTAQSISEALGRSTGVGVGAVALEAAEASVLGARGNCGMMLSHFLLGFAERIEGQTRITARQFVQAMEAGVQHLQNALEEPREGTMLTVMRDSASAAASAQEGDFVPLLDELLDASRDSLERTPELLPVLKTAGVVDAGAKGFVALLEGIVALIHGDPLLATSSEFGDDGALDPEAPAAVALAEFDVEETYRYCTEALVRGGNLPASPDVRATLHDLGDSLIVIRTGDVLKIHIHTDTPDDVFDYLRTLGTLATHKAEDMQAQHAAVERSAAAHVNLARRPVTVVTDSAADLPDEVLRAHGIHVVPLMLMDGDETLRDRIDISAEEFAARLDDEGPLPTTSQPSPGAFLDVYARAAQEGEELVVVSLGSGLSGTLQSAEAAATRFDDAPVTIVDSKGASSLQGLLALKAAELAELATPAADIAREIERIRGQSGVLFTVDTFDRLIASGRVGKGRAWLGRLLDVKPILGVTPEGTVAPFGKVRGRDKVVGATLDIVAEQIPAGAEKVRFALAHVRAEDRLDAVEAEVRRRFGNVDVLRSTATPVVATHVGVGAWCIAWMVED